MDSFKRYRISNSFHHNTQSAPIEIDALERILNWWPGILF